MAEREAKSGLSHSDESIISNFVADPELRKLLDYWRSKRQGRLIPSKSDIDPIDIAWALSRIFLADFSPEDGFRYRLAGAEISSVIGRANLKGLNLRDVVKPERIEAVEKIWLQAVETRCIVSMKGMVYYGLDRTPIGERLLLPLVDGETDEVTGVLGMTVCEWVAGDVPEEIKLARCDSIPVASVP